MGYVKIQVVATATGCSLLQKVATLFIQKGTLIYHDYTEMYCFMMIILMNDTRIVKKKEIKMMKKKVQTAATIRAAVCDLLQVLPTYFNISC